MVLKTRAEKAPIRPEAGFLLIGPRLFPDYRAAIDGRREKTNDRVEKGGDADVVQGGAAGNG